MAIESVGLPHQCLRIPDSRVVVNLHVSARDDFTAEVRRPHEPDRSDADHDAGQQAEGAGFETLAATIGVL
jgi:hypothetical protein